MNDATPKTFTIEKGLTRRQKTALRKIPPVEQIKTRREDGAILAYLEGWYLIAEANRIFGTENWDRITLTTQCVWQGKSNGRPACAYTARVRLCIRTGLTSVVREGAGFGEAEGRSPGEVHGQAMKTAETDATKRALATLGAPFGLTLYDRDHPASREAVARDTPPEAADLISGCVDGARNGYAATPGCISNIPLKLEAPWVAYGPAGEAVGVFRDPVICCSAIRRTIESAKSTAELEAIYSANRRTMARLHAEKPDLRSKTNQHYTTILSKLFEVRLKRQPQPSAEARQS